MADGRLRGDRFHAVRDSAVRSALCVAAMMLLASHAATAAPPEDAVLTVAADGSGRFGSIAEAVAAAPDGAVVRVGPGTFDEHVVVTKSVTIEGAGADRTTLVAKAPDPTLRVSNARAVVVRGVTLSSRGERPNGGALQGGIVEVADSELRFERAAVVGGPGSGVTIGQGSNVEIDGCLVAGVWNTGIVVGVPGEHPSTVLVSNSDIRNCWQRGITVAQGNSAVTIERCRISGSSWHGIRYDSAAPVVRGNVIFGNLRSGIYASGSTSGRIEGNLFFRNGMSDVSCWFDAKDVIEGNSFVESQREAVAILGPSAPTIRKNVFAECKTALMAGAVAGKGGSRSDYQGGGAIEGNVLWHAGTKFLKPGADGKSQAESPLPAGNVVADPLFTDAAHRDYSLAAASPARAAGAGVAAPLSFDSPWAPRPDEAAIAPKEAAEPKRPGTAPAASPVEKQGAGPVDQARADILQVGDAARRERGLAAMGEALRSDDPKVVLAALCALWDIRDVGYDKERYRTDILRHLASPDFAIGQKAAQALLRLDRRPGDLDEVLTGAERLPVTPPWMLWAALHLNEDRADGRLSALFVKALAVDDPEDGAMVTANNLRRMWVSAEVDDAVVAAWRRHPTGRNGSGMWPFVLGQMTSPAREARVRAVFELMASGDDAMRQLAGLAVTRPVEESAKPVAAKLAADAIATAKTPAFRRTYLDVIRANGSREQVPMLRDVSRDAAFGDELRALVGTIADELER